MSGTPQTRRRRLLDKLGAVCAQIEQILAGQDLRIQDVKLPQERQPGETPLERLQRFKALLSEALAELARGEPRRCRHCQAPLSAQTLDELRWAWSCGCGD